MTAAQMAIAIGQRVNWNASKDIKVECEVRDVKQAYGNTLLLIVPVAGIGYQWVNMSSVSKIVGNQTPIGWDKV